MSTFITVLVSLSVSANLAIAGLYLYGRAQVSFKASKSGVQTIDELRSKPGLDYMDYLRHESARNLVERIHLIETRLTLIGSALDSHAQWIVLQQKLAKTHPSKGAGVN